MASQLVSCQPKNIMSLYYHKGWCGICTLMTQKLLRSNFTQLCYHLRNQTVTSVEPESLLTFIKVVCFMSMFLLSLSSFFFYDLHKLIFRETLKTRSWLKSLTSDDPVHTLSSDRKYSYLWKSRVIWEISGTQRKSGHKSSWVEQEIWEEIQKNYFTFLLIHLTNISSVTILCQRYELGYGDVYAASYNHAKCQLCYFTYS